MGFHSFYKRIISEHRNFPDMIQWYSNKLKEGGAENGIQNKAGGPEKV